MQNGGKGERQRGYVPFTDPTGPFMYFPFHCTAIDEKNIHASPVVAYIKQDNVV